MPHKFAIGAVAVLLWASPIAAATLDQITGRYEIDPSSQISFSVDQVGGGGFAGRFPQFSGRIELVARMPERSKVTFRIMPASVATGESRIDHFLRSDAVFDAARHPVITFASTRVRLLDARRAIIEGVLSARGRSRTETFTATMVETSGRNVTFHVVGNVLRSPYGMDVGTPIYSNIVRFDMTIRAHQL